MPRRTTIPTNVHYHGFAPFPGFTAMARPTLMLRVWWVWWGVCGWTRGAGRCGSNTLGHGPVSSFSLPIRPCEDPREVVSSARELTAEEITAASLTRWHHLQRPARAASSTRPMRATINWPMGPYGQRESTSAGAMDDCPVAPSVGADHPGWATRQWG
jgi:hypothetical protein